MMFKPHSLFYSFLLHQRAYRDTSLLVELFTREHGRITAVARGVRAAKSKTKNILQPFVPLMTSFTGKTELLTLCTVEACGKAPILKGESLFSALYLNELLVRTLHRFDSAASLYDEYEKALQALIHVPTLQKTLRQFEKSLLQELGYALVLNKEANAGTTVEAEQFYYYVPQHGIVLPADQSVSLDNPTVFKGESLLSLHEGVLETTEQLRDAKRLMRIALAPLLGGKPLKSRELFVK